MKKYILYLFSSLLLFSSAIATDDSEHGNNNQEQTTTVKDTSSKFQEEYINILKEMSVSMKGKTDKGNEYSLFAIKKGGQWTYLIMDDNGYYSVRQEKGSNEMSENTQSHTEMLCLMAKAKLLKKISKPRNVSELTFSCYYKFKPQAKKTYKSYNKIQGKAKYLKANLKKGKAGRKKIFEDSMK